MLTASQKKYLDNLSQKEAGRIIESKHYSQELANIASNIIDRISKIIPKTRIEFMGASALGISGQNDIDIYILVPEQKRAEVIDQLKPTLGEQEKNKWHWIEKNFEVSVYVTDPETQSQKEQIQIYEILKNNRELLKEYEQLKLSMNGKTYKEYQTVKYEFYNKLLTPGLT